MKASRTVRHALAGLLALATTPAVAQRPIVLTTIPTPQDPAAIPLGTGGVPGGAARENWTASPMGGTARNVTRATLTPVLPARGKATGAAVVIAPGGAFLGLEMEGEGFAVARWLADHGIAAFVLKYRIRPTPLESREFDKLLRPVLNGKPLQPGQTPPLSTPPYAVEDGQAAVRMVRAGAGQWNVDPRRVGMLGFSAGAMTTLEVALRSPPDARPAFIAPIYPPMNAVAVPTGSPPMFVALAMDDPLFGQMGYGLVESWHRAARPVELHVYQTGGHGFGLGRPDSDSADWIVSFHHWLETNGFLKGVS